MPYADCVTSANKGQEQVLQQRRDGQMSDRDLVDWATMATINDAYYWDKGDAVLAEWIGRLHLDTFPEP